MFYERYWENKSGHLDDFVIKWPKLKQFIPLEKGAVVVDFGCGKGDILKEIAAINPHAKCIGLDVSKRALELAKSQLPDFDFHKIEDGGLFPLRDASADFVFSSEVIEHVYDTENAFREIARVLRPRGRLLLTTPYHGLLKNLALVLFGFDRHFNPAGPHVRFFSNNALARMLGAVGIGIQEWHYYGRFWPLSHSVVVLAEKEVSET